jgi:outer membrane lipoprotein SlyB
MGMRRLVITALVTAAFGGVLSAALNLGTVASDALLVGAIALTLPFVLGISTDDVRARLHRR